ncbi:MAG: glutamate synthase subunit beta [Deltaproteobacteria bacterium]|nr:glutamate synthase subunit beta [Deltaproteobacteria bacterium]
MGDPKGFLKIARKGPPKRPVEERLKDWREVYQPMPEADLRAQASRCMDCGIPFCHMGCPLGNIIPDWNDLVYRGYWREAIDRLHATNNFPEFTGTLCPAPCEESCVLRINTDPVTIKQIEIHIINRAFEEGWIQPEPPAKRTGKRVAIVGSGPAGLAAAEQLNRAGHTVVVFERDNRIGGLLRYGIPDFKLEKWVLDRRLKIMEESGIQFRTGVNVGKNISAPDLHKEFDAIILCGGATQARDLLIPGRELKGIHPAMDYLTQQNRICAGDKIDSEERITAEGKRVVIIGGGDTGADCLGTANRQGAAQVVQLEILPRPPDVRVADDPWPLWPNVFRSSPAHDEGVERGYSISTKRFSGNGSVEKLHTVRVEWISNGDGRKILREIPGTESEIETQLVLLAMGFVGPEKKPLLEQLGVELDPRGNVKTDENKRTSVPGIFAAGDVRRGQSLIVWAIAEGREAAYGADQYLTGETMLPVVNTRLVLSR